MLADERRNPLYRPVFKPGDKVVAIICSYKSCCSNGNIYTIEAFLPRPKEEYDLCVLKEDRNKINLYCWRFILFATPMGNPIITREKRHNA